MRRTWLIFSQAVTVAVAVLFVVATLKPEWLPRMPAPRRAWSTPPVPHVATLPAALRAAAAAAAATAPRHSAPRRRWSASPPARRRPRSPAQQRPLVPLLLRRRRRSPQAAAGRARLGRDRLGRGLPADQQPRHRRRRRHRGACSPTAARPRREVVGTDPETDLAVLKIELDRLPAITFGDADSTAGGRCGAGHRQPLRRRARPSPRASSARWAATSSASTPSRTSSRPTPRSTPATPAARWSTPQATWWASTPRSTRARGGSLGIGFAIPVDTARQVMEGLIQDGQVTRGWIGVEPRDLTPEIAADAQPARSSRAC